MFSYEELQIIAGALVVIILVLYSTLKRAIRDYNAVVKRLNRANEIIENSHNNYDEDENSYYYQGEK